MRRALACLAALAVVAAGWAISSEDPAAASSKWRRGPNKRNHYRRAYRTYRVNRYRPRRTYARRCAPKRRVVRSYAYYPSKRTYYKPSTTTYTYRPATTTYATPRATTTYRAPAIATAPSRPAASVAAATAAPIVVGSTEIAPPPAPPTPTTLFVPVSPMATPAISPTFQYSGSCSNYT